MSDGTYENTDINEILDMDLDGFAEPGELPEGEYVGELVKIRERAFSTGTKAFEVAVKAVEVISSADDVDEDTLPVFWPVRHTLFYKNKNEINTNVLAFLSSKFGVSIKTAQAENPSIAGLKDYLDYVEGERPRVRFSFTRELNDKGYKQEKIRFFRHKD